MKKVKTIAVWIVIVFCIDYSVTQLMGFDLIYNRVHDLTLWGKVYAFVIGVSGFLSILKFQNEDE